MKQSRSIMLIEDDKDDQEFFMEALSEIENVILYGVANNGRIALDRLQNEYLLPDLIFSDIQMPVMNGLECLTEIKDNPRTRNIPVVILSTSVAQSELVCSLGAKAFVKKPTECRILREQIEKIICENFIVADQIPVPVIQLLNVAA